MLPQQLELPQMQTTWAQALNPVIANPIVKGLILEQVQLVTGTNVINHKLGRKLQGWYTTRVRSAVSLYDQQDTNQTPELTLIIVASAPATINLAVF
jgi:hypothetical protein